MKSVKLFLTLIATALFLTMAFVLNHKIHRPNGFHANSDNTNLEDKPSIEVFSEEDPIVKENQLDNKAINSDLAKSLLNDPNSYILQFVDKPFDYGYGSNSIPLVISSLLTTGDLLELGMGMFSTKLLNRISSHYNRSLVSIDTDKEWVDKFVNYNSELHKIYYLNNYTIMSQFGLDKNWGLVLVDHINANLRPKDVINFANKAQIVIAHDAENQFEGFYQYEQNKIRSYFNSSCKFSVYRNIEKSVYISTIMLSNFIDLSILKPIFDKVKTDYGHVSCDVDY